MVVWTIFTTGWILKLLGQPYPRLQEDMESAKAKNKHAVINCLRFLMGVSVNM